MAWTTAQIDALLVAELRRPAVDALLTAAVRASYLTQAQEHWASVINAVAAQIHYGAPTLLVTGDAGLTYTFPNGAEPEGQIELYESKTGRQLLPGAYWDLSKDFVHEGGRIRWTGGRTRTFADGPYARYAVPPTRIADDLSTALELKPEKARPLIAYRAAVLLCQGPLQRDPTGFLAKEQRLWHGDPRMGDHGLLAVLRNQYDSDGLSGVGDISGAYWWRSIDSGEGYGS